MIRQREWDRKRAKRFAAAGVAVFLAATFAIGWFVGRPMLQFLSEPERFRSWMDQHGIWGPLAFVGMMILQVFIAVIPGEPLEIGAGYAFGVWEGTLLCMIGATIGGMLVFLFVRKFGMKAVEIFFSKEKIQNLWFLKHSGKRNVLVFLIFLIPGTPKDLISYFVGLTDMKVSMWLVVNLVARIPSIVTSTVGGDALGMKNYQFAIVVFAATLVVSGAGILIYHLLCRRNSRRVEQTETPDDQA